MTVNTQNSFEAMGLPPLLVKNLAQMGVAEPKPIQVKAIEPLLAGRDILAIAQTGSGKTFAFSLPILAKIIGMGAKRQPKAATALILTPTRELAVQIEEALRAAAKDMHLRLALVLGGVSRLKQIKQMAAGADVLIATPGRLMDHVREGNIDLSKTQFFVLDEADRMLDMGFIRDVRAIAGRLAKNRQTALFSATMPKEIAGLADSLLNKPLKVETAPQGTTVAAIRETVYAVPQNNKKHVLTKLLAQEDYRSVIVFTRTKHGADAVERFLAKAGCAVDVIHGNKSQNARLRALDAFRKGRIRALIATDIAARGIDVPGISHVVNFEFPVEAESYVHRIGRTGRNGAAGDAVTLYDAGQEASRLRAIQKLTGKKLFPQAVPELAEAVFPKMAPAPEEEKPGGKAARRPRRGFEGGAKSGFRRSAGGFGEAANGRGKRGARFGRGEERFAFDRAEQNREAEGFAADRPRAARINPRSEADSAFHDGERGENARRGSGPGRFKPRGAEKSAGRPAFGRPQGQKRPGSASAKPAGGKRFQTKRAAKRAD